MPHNCASTRMPVIPWEGSNKAASTAVTIGDKPNTMAIQPEGMNCAPQ